MRPALSRFKDQELAGSGLGLEEGRDALAFEGLAALWPLEAGLAHGRCHRVPLQVFAVVGLHNLHELPARCGASALLTCCWCLRKVLFTNHTDLGFELWLLEQLDEVPHPVCVESGICTKALL